MIDALIRWSLVNRALVIAGAGLLIIWGSFEAARMPVDVFPDLTAPTVTVIADAHGMAPEDVEQLLTLPIETAMNGANGVRRVRSRTQVGVGVVYVDFEWGTDIFRARQIVNERLQLVSSNLPPGLDSPVMGPVTSIMGDILFIGLTSDKHSAMELRTLGQWRIAKRLLAVPGVAQAITMGGGERQYQVLLEPRRLDAFEVTADEVAHALEVANENTSAGFLVEAGQEHLIQGVGRVNNSDDIAQTLVTMRGARPVLVGDVGSVQIGPGHKRGEAGVDGHQGVVIGIRKQPHANTIELTQRIEEALEALRVGLPEGVTLHESIFRQADFIEVAIDNVGGALKHGALLVVLTVLLFLLSFRGTLITALAIPLSLLAAVLAMRAQDIEINTMTLGGMAIAVGALVDDAVIDVENIVRRLRLNQSMPAARRRPLLEVVFDASREVRRSIVFATLVIIIVFAPLAFLTGVEGRLLRPLGFAYVASLLASLVVALTITPALSLWLLPRTTAVNRQREPWLVRQLKATYRPLLAASLGRWRLLSMLSFAGLAVAGYALSHAGGAFLPAFNEGALTISVSTLPGTSLGESSRLAKMAENIALGHPEVLSTARRTGRAEQDEHAQPVSSTEMEAKLAPMSVQARERFLERLRTSLQGVPGSTIIIGQPLEHRIDHMLSGTRSSVAVKIFGRDLRTLRRLGAEVRATLATIDGVVDLHLEQQTDVPFVTIRFNRAKIARYGLTIEAVAHEIETAFLGRAVTRVMEGDAAFDLIVRYDNKTTSTLHAIRETHIGTPQGARLPLHEVAHIERAVGPNVISRENVERKIVVSCNVAGRDLEAVVAEVKADVASQVRLDEGYRVEFGGQFESAQRAKRIVMWVSLLVLFGVFLLLRAALGTTRDAGLVLINLPLALIGGVGGVFLAGGVISVASLIGFITLFGIATRNGIMLVTHVQHLMQVEGLPLRKAVEQGAEERLSPILMTALASGLGLLPLVLSGGQPGSEIEAPMATVILCGLSTATVLNMVLIPALYLRFGALTAPEAVEGMEQAPENAPTSRP